MKILLTGATGFIGKNIKEYFEKNHLLSDYDIKTPKRGELDLSDENATEEYLKKEKFDVVIHTANTNDFRDRLTSYDILNNNLRMFFNLERCNGCYGKMLYLGSGAEFDFEHYKPLMEEEYFGKHIPKDPYGLAKYTMNMVAQKSRNIYNLRLFGVYGRYEQWQRRFISNAICRSIKGMPITISQNVYFDYLYIDDFCRILKWFTDNTPLYHSCNVCTSKPVTLKTLAEKVNEITGLNREIIISREGFKREYSGDNKKMIQQVGNIEFTPFHKGIKELYDYYLEIQDHIDEKQLI